MPIGPLAGVSSAAFTPLAALADTATTGATAANKASSAGFGDAVVGALNDLSAAHHTADDLATKAATGNLADVHDYTIAATEASLATELTVAVRNKAVEAFNSIMSMGI
jgi:flagellar hook-basal body complex protein FliE